MEGENRSFACVTPTRRREPLEGDAEAEMLTDVFVFGRVAGQCVFRCIVATGRRITPRPQMQRASFLVLFHQCLCQGAPRCVPESRSPVMSIEQH